MSDPASAPLTVAASENLIQALTFALSYDRKRQAVRQDDQLSARVAAARLVEYLQRSGFVVMQKLAAPARDFCY